MLGAIMFSSKQLLEFLPNVELVSTLTMVYTLVYRKRALIPIFLFILMEGILHGFATWWLPYFYLWPILWGITMLLPKTSPERLQAPVYAITCSLFGLAYGSLYAPFQAVIYLGGDLSKMYKWILAGLPFDIVHAQGNLGMGLLIVPMVRLLRELEARLSGSSTPL